MSGSTALRRVLWTLNLMPANGDSRWCSPVAQLESGAWGARVWSCGGVVEMQTRGVAATLAEGGLSECSAGDVQCSQTHTLMHTSGTHAPPLTPEFILSGDASWWRRVLQTR
eukprot:723275-Rhodomonas_salina.3